MSNGYGSNGCGSLLDALPTSDHRWGCVHSAGPAVARLRGASPMNVVQVPRRFVASEWGGTETVVLQTSKRLLAMGHHTEILCANALAGCDVEVVDGVRVRRVPYTYPYWFLRDEAKRQLDKKGGNLFSFALMKALRAYPDLDVIHMHTLKRVGGIGRHVARKRRIPYVVTLHGGVFDVPAQEADTMTRPTRGAFEWGKVLGMWVGSRRVLDDAAAVICVGTEEQREVQRRFPHKRVVHLPNGVDADHFAEGDGHGFRRRHGIARQARVLLTVGRIDSQKNQLFAVRCLPRLLECDAGVHLVLIGHVSNEAYCGRVMAEAERLGVGGRVCLIRGLPADGQDLVDAYHAADMFLLPSIHEPFGIVILEAWAAGLPVMASRVGGVPSFVSEGQDGILFEPDNERDFQAAFRALWGSPERMMAIAQAGQTKAREHYSWDHVTKALVQLYEEVVRENPLRQ